jgi:hypothetical protein
MSVLINTISLTLSKKCSGSLQSAVVGQSYYIGYLSGNDVMVGEFDLNLATSTKPGVSGLEWFVSEALHNKGSWTFTSVATAPVSAAPAKPIKSGGVAFAAGNSALWIIYSDVSVSNGALVARSRSVVPGTADGFSKPLEMYLAGGTNRAWGETVTATMFDEDQLIVVSKRKSNTDAFIISLYKVSDIDGAGGTWVAAYSQAVNINTDIQLYSAGALKTNPDGSQSNQPVVTLGPAVPGKDYKAFIDGGADFRVAWHWTSGGYYAVLTYTPKSPVNDNKFGNAGLKDQTLWAFVPFVVQDGQIVWTPGPATANSTDPAPWGSGTIMSYSLPIGLWGLESGVTRDPAGRLKSYLRSYMGDWVNRICDGAVPPQGIGGSPSGVKSAENPDMSQSTSAGVNFDFGNTMMPAGSFYPLIEGRVTQDPPDGSTQTDIPLIEMILFTHASDEIMIQTRHYGTLRIAENQDPMPIDETLIVGAIVDGGIPIPLENFENYNAGSDTAYVASIIYTNEEETSTTTAETGSSSFMVGTSGEPVNTSGPVWDASFAGGPTWATHGEKIYKLTRNIEARATVSTEIGANAPPPSIPKQGILQTYTPEIRLTAYEVLDPSGQVIDQNESIQAKINIGMTSPKPTLMPLYSVTPGVLESYTPEGLNATMTALAQQYPDAGLYDGNNYFGDIICQNAYPFVDRHEPYLSFTWTEAGDSRGWVKSSQSAFKEQGWKLDLKLHAGFSASFEVPIFEWGMKAQAIAGMDYSYTASVGQGTQKSWSLGVKPDEAPFGVPRGDSANTKAVTQYSWRMYMLPVPFGPSTLPPNYWSVEMIKYMQDGPKIDPNSGAMRIISIVDSIQRRKDGKNYLYDGTLDKVSVYAT